MPVKVITAPAEYPLTLAEAKTYAKATSDTSEDAWITLLIISATQLFEEQTNRTVASCTLEQSFDCFATRLRLEAPPVQSITHIKYDDVDGAEQTLSSSIYVFDNSSDQRGHITKAVGADWPDTQSGALNTVRVRYVAGFASAALVPARIKLWIGAQVAHWFNHREAYADRQLISQPSLDGIVNNYRLPGV